MHVCFYTVIDQILALVAVRKAMDYVFSQHELSFLDDVIPEKDKKKKEDEKKKKKKARESIDSDVDEVIMLLVLLLLCIFPYIKNHFIMHYLNKILIVDHQTLREMIFLLIPHGC